MIMKKVEFITQDLLSKIYQQSFEGNKLPNQRDLADIYHVSRDTVQKALGRLTDMGLIRSVRGSGIFIKNAGRKNPLIYNSLTQNPYDRIRSETVFLKKIMADENDCRIFGLKKPQPIWIFQRIRIVNFQIVQIETSKMPVALFQDLTAAIIEHSVQEYVQSAGFNISHYITSYSPVLLDKSQAKLLQCKPHLPAMKIINRSLLDDGRVYEYSEVIALDYTCTYIVPFNKLSHAERQQKKADR
ncbi:GntR family transcriptional regulator [Lactobacillus sakei] [Lactiplantibacillus mudanjiangensis]|uniref:GntR family transcriptional regulator [Lactobacillus sakei] n=2 Tax=Lactiplantibacillus mudanjiangensis TaxID=1296538 RepID=A0A660DUP6_9LACO|nr:GntR family transcriptional regulator [Lactobacillus sakei] [Lactiplantibacillus mudanjiangensis]VDG26892.1 GntR family transcriptional regulator [Lactobacillus sakei] [Lactiplantibacillus mudanjiangensis]